MVTAAEISKRLSADVDRVCRWLLPNGKQNNGHWIAGSVNGEKGKSLEIELHGERAGLWLDRANETDRGDLLDLIKSVRGGSLSSAIGEAKGFLGIQESDVVLKRAYKPAKPVHIGKPNPVSKAMTYLLTERKLTAETLEKCKVRPSKNDDAYCFPRFNADGALANVKTVKLERDAAGKKQEWQEKDAAPVMFGWPAVGDSRDVIITEGEIDALTFQQLGFPALSAPNGATGMTWIEHEFDRLQQFDTIWIAFDNDKPGQDAVETVAKRLGRHRCFRLILPDHKDANEALQAGRDVEFFSRAVADAKPFMPPEIKRPTDYTDDVLAWFHPEGEHGPGFFPVLFDDNVGFRPAELTIWTGISGHGKSVFLSQMMIEAMQQGAIVAIASMEMPGKVTIGRMVRQLDGQWCPAPEAARTHLEWLTGKLWIFNVLGNITPDKLAELMEYVTARYGVTHFVVDSLMKVGVAGDDYEAQRKFTGMLSTFAIVNDVHVHLVAHGRKLPNEAEAPGKMDVKGSSDITNQADNILSIWRNKAKEEARQEGIDAPPTDPDCIVACTKQRATGWEGKFRMLYNWTSHRYSLCERKQR